MKPSGRPLRWAARYAGEAAAFLLPASCFGCGRLLGRVQRSGACPSCWASLAPVSGPACGSCGLPLPGAASSPRCLVCAATPPPFARAAAAVLYRGFARAVVLRAKGGRRIEMLGIMAEQLALAVRHAGLDRECDGLVPVPGRPLARLTRGFDHAGVLAARLGALLAVPVRSDLLRSTLAAITPLKGLSAEARRKAAGRRVVARRSARGLRVVLVDDVMTTGATAGAAARALAGAGARSIGVAVWARTPAQDFDRGRERPV